ncbi:MAG: hypothetical protein JWN04_6490 [Myxococcaceae bacterium]|nr:hypothetical protein [Myxococcaceae bacterium]
MIDAPERPTPRFPASRVDYVRAQIRDKLALRTGNLVGVSSAADGADLLFIEEVLAREGRVVVFLPFGIADFEQTSVKEAWRARFRRALAAPGVELREPLYPSLPATQEGQNRAFAEVNAAIVATAEALAGSLHDQDPWFLAVYQRAKTDQQGGTGDAFGDWTKKGRTLVTIDPMGNPDSVCPE